MMSWLGNLLRRLRESEANERAQQLAELRYRPDSERVLYRQAMERRNIEVLYHATFSAALSAMARTNMIASGLSRIDPPFPLPAGGTSSRFVDLYSGYVSLSIDPFTKYMNRLVRMQQNSICLILVDPTIIELEGVAFSPRMSDCLSDLRRELDATAYDDFDRLFLSPTDSQPISKSHKILVPGSIPTEF